MSNVRITATGDEDLSVEVLLGDANRAWRDLDAGDSVDLAVGGNQTLKIGLAREAPSVFITPDDEPAVETPFVEGQDELPVGVDVLGQDQPVPPTDDESDPVADEDTPPLFATADAEIEATPEREQFVIGAGEVGSVKDIGIINDLEADSPLEVGSISDLPNPFDTEGDVKEAEDEGGAEVAQP